MVRTWGFSHALTCALSQLSHPLDLPVLHNGRRHSRPAESIDAEMSGKIDFPSGFGIKDLVAWGNTGMMLLDKPTTPDTVIKTPHDHEECSSSIDAERQIYESFSQRGGHRGILYYYGTFEAEFARPFRLPRPSTWPINRVSFMVISTAVFLHETLDPKLGDYTGSSLDGSLLLVLVTPSHRYPGPALSVQGYLFALGSVLYKVMSGSKPYPGLSDEDISAYSTRVEFLET